MSVKSRKIKFRDNDSVKLFNPDKRSSDLYSISKMSMSAKTKKPSRQHKPPKRSKYGKSTQISQFGSIGRSHSQQIRPLNLDNERSLERTPRKRHTSKHRASMINMKNKGYSGRSRYSKYSSGGVKLSNSSLGGLSDL